MGNGDKKKYVALQNHIYRKVEKVFFIKVFSKELNGTCEKEKESARRKSCIHPFSFLLE